MIRFRGGREGELLVSGILICLGLTACSPVLRFQPDDSSAKLRYVTTGLPSDQTILLQVDTQSCPANPGMNRIADTGGVLGSPEQVSTVDMIGSSSRPEALVRELYIPTRGPFVFLLHASRGMAYECDNGGVFQPHPGREYELRYVIAPETFVCIVQIDELLREPGAARRREPTAHFFHPPKKRTEYCNVTARKDNE